MGVDEMNSINLARCRGAEPEAERALQGVGQQSRGTEMPSDKDEAIAKRAYKIWEDEGRPHGRHDHHWTEAERHVGMMGDGTEEQNLDQKGNPSARITEAEVKEAFSKDGKK